MVLFELGSLSKPVQLKLVLIVVWDVVTGLNFVHLAPAHDKQILNIYISTTSSITTAALIQFRMTSILIKLHRQPTLLPNPHIITFLTTIPLHTLLLLFNLIPDPLLTNVLVGGLAHRTQPGVIRQQVAEEDGGEGV